MIGKLIGLTGLAFGLLGFGGVAIAAPYPTEVPDEGISLSSQHSLGRMNFSIFTSNGVLGQVEDGVVYATRTITMVTMPIRRTQTQVVQMNCDTRQARVLVTVVGILGDESAGTKTDTSLADVWYDRSNDLPMANACTRAVTANATTEMNAASERLNEAILDFDRSKK